MSAKKSQLRVGAHIITRPRERGPMKAGLRDAKKEQNENCKDLTKSGSFARDAVNEQKRADLAIKRGERETPYTRAEFDAIRREEEQVNRDRLLKLRLEYEKSENTIRKLEIERRRNGQ
jgi:hypothetical protein